MHCMLIFITIKTLHVWVIMEGSIRNYKTQNMRIIDFSYNTVCYDIVIQPLSCCGRGGNIGVGVVEEGGGSRLLTAGELIV